MFIKIFLNYIIGYLQIEVEGYFVERFINICLTKKILLWDIKRSKATLINACIGIKNFRKVRNIAKDTKCRVKIKAKKGIPFIFYKYKKRKIFFAILFLITIAIVSLSNFVWNIEIIGNNKISKEELMESLKSEGLQIGSKKNNINTKQIISNMRLNRDDLAWIGIEVKGTNAIIKVVEADKKPEIIDENQYCNIVATKARNNYKNKCTKRHCPSKRRRHNKKGRHTNRRMARRKVYRNTICTRKWHSYGKSLVYK